LRLRRTSSSCSSSSRKKPSQSSTTPPSSSHPLSSLLPVPFVLLPSSPIVARLQEDGRRSLASASQAFEVRLGFDKKFCICMYMLSLSLPSYYFFVAVSVCMDLLLFPLSVPHPALPLSLPPSLLPAPRYAPLPFYI
jgi:hypothetical protein